METETRNEGDHLSRREVLTRGAVAADSTITTRDGTRIFYKDWGKGQPIVFSHGWPLSADDWDAQLSFFSNRGYRVIAHDRRGARPPPPTPRGPPPGHHAVD